MSVMKLIYFIIVVFQTTMQRSRGSSAHLVPDWFAEENSMLTELGKGRGIFKVNITPQWDSRMLT